jgi:hypothetical protein
LRTNAENLCPRGDVDPKHMITISETLYLTT